MQMLPSNRVLRCSEHCPKGRAKATTLPAGGRKPGKGRLRRRNVRQGFPRTFVFTAGVKTYRHSSKSPNIGTPQTANY